MKIVPSEFIWFNGEFVPWDEARIHVLSHVVHYGSGVFEGIRAYAGDDGPAVLGLDLHVQRFVDSCRIIEMPLRLSAAQLRAAVLEIVRRNKHRACYIRPLAFRGYHELGLNPHPCPVEVIIATFEVGTLMGSEALTNGVDVGVSSWRRMAPDTHPAMAKACGNYVNSSLVYSEASRHGYGEGIALDIDGYVSEGSGENVFFVRAGALWTPPAGDSILEGVTRGFVIELARDADLEVREQRIPREMLYVSDEVFLCGTAAEITPVRSVDGRTVGNGKPGPVTLDLQRRFFDIVEGRTDDRRGWLTPVTPR